MQWSERDKRDLKEDQGSIRQTLTLRLKKEGDTFMEELPYKLVQKKKQKNGKIYNHKRMPSKTNVTSKSKGKPLVFWNANVINKLNND